jgi:hypothetical protein
MDGLFVDLDKWREIHVPCSIGDAGQWILAVLRVTENGPRVCIFDSLNYEMGAEKKAFADHMW